MHEALDSGTVGIEVRDVPGKILDLQGDIRALVKEKIFINQGRLIALKGLSHRDSEVEAFYNRQLAALDLRITKLRFRIAKLQLKMLPQGKSEQADKILSTFTSISTPDPLFTDLWQSHQILVQQLIDAVKVYKSGKESN